MTLQITYMDIFGFKSEVTKVFMMILISLLPQSNSVVANYSSCRNYKKDTYKFVSNDEIKIYVKNGFMDRNGK